MADELEELLQSSETGRRITPREIIPGVVPFTEGAYKKADMIGPIIKELTGRDLEWSAFMLAQQGDPNYVVRDLLLQEGQDIRFGNVEIKGEDVARASAKVQERNQKEGTNFYVIGWIHGHGISFLVPSTTDRQNFETVINSVALNTEQHVLVPLRLIETEAVRKMRNGRIIQTGRAVEDAVIEYSLREDARLRSLLRRHGIEFEEGEEREKALSLLYSLLGATSIEYQQANIFGFSYFVIMNNRHEKPYAAIAWASERAITRTRRAELIEGLEIKRVAAGNDIVVSEESLEQEIRDNIDLPKKGLFSLFGTYEGGSYWDGGYSGGRGQPYWGRGAHEHAFWMSRELLRTLEGRISECEDPEDKSKMREVKSLVEMLGKVERARTRNAQMEIIDSYFRRNYGWQPAEEQETDELLGREPNSPDYKGGGKKE